MPALKTGIVALVLIAGLTASAQAQAPKSANGGVTGAYPASQVTTGLSAYYGMAPNYSSFGLSGTYPSNGGFGYPGYGPGPQFGAHSATDSEAKPPQASAPKPVAPIKGVSKAAGKRVSPGKGTTRSVPLPRKGL